MTQDDMSKSEMKSTERSKGQESLVGSLLTTQATLVAWLVFLGFGSAILASYYAHLHYLPEFKWEESFAYLTAVTVLGGGLVAVYVLLLYLPGWIWSEFLIFDSELEQGPLCYPGGPDGKKHEPCYWNIAKHLVLPFAVLMVAIHFAMLAGGRPLIATTIVGLPGLIWYSRCVFKDVLKTKSLITQAPRHSLLLKYTTASGVAALVSIVSLFILYLLIDPSGEHWSLLVVCTVAVVVSNLLVAVQFRDKPTRAVLTGIISAITLLICGEIIPVDGQTQSERILNIFGVGDEELAVNLVITVPGRKLLADSGVAVVEKVTLKSRLGEEYLVEWHEPVKGGRQIERRAALPKNMVDYWTSSRELKPAAKPAVKQALSESIKVACCFASGFLVLLLFALHSLMQRWREADLGSWILLLHSLIGWQEAGL